MAQQKSTREERLKAALRNNLRNRKAQQRRLDSQEEAGGDHRLRERDMDITDNDKNAYQYKGGLKGR